MACNEEVINSAELAKKWNVPESWVRDQVRSRAKDPVPHVRLGRYIRFEWCGEALKRWWERRRKHSKQRTGGDSNERRIQ